MILLMNLQQLSLSKNLQMHPEQFKVEKFESNISTVYTYLYATLLKPVPPHVFMILLKYQKYKIYSITSKFQCQTKIAVN